MASSREQVAAMELASYGSKEEPVVDDEELGSEGADLARIERVYRKIDRRIIPRMTAIVTEEEKLADIDAAFWILYFLCSAIRSNVGLAQTMNSAQGHDLSDVLHLTPKQVSTGLALFYVCYVVFDCPSNLIMSKLSPHVWMSRIVLSVGVIGTC
ncbi:MFS general substrate transporter, partial [Aureobasidium melanogenum]